MPTYDFQDKQTGEIVTRIMKIADRDQFLLDNPNMEPYHGVAPSMGDPVRLGFRKIDGGFKEVLQKISERTPGGKALKGNSTQQV